MVKSLMTSWRTYPMWLQWVATIAVTLKLFNCGLGVGWGSPYAAKFLSGDSEFPATVEEVSWISSAQQLGRIPGAILGAIGLQYFGSRRMLIGTGLGLLISWILLIIADSVPWLYVIRFIWGFVGEAVSTNYVLYLGDISSPEIRGTITVLATNGIATGILVAYSIGPYVSMKVFACVGLVSTVISLVIMLLLPDSPYYLASEKKFKEAEKSILAFNRKAEVDKELRSVNIFVAKTKLIKFPDRLRELNLPHNRNATINLIIIIFFGQLTGTNILTAYQETISDRAMLTLIPASTMPIVTTALCILGAWITSLFVDKWQRRVIWSISSGGVGLCLTAMGVHFYLLSIGVDPSSLQWPFLLTMGSFGFFLSVGISTVPYILLGELFGASIRTVAVCICCSFSGIFGFFSIYSYQYLIDHIAEAYVYWILAVIAFVSLLYGILLVPRTKGKTLTEIQTDLIKK